MLRRRFAAIALFAVPALFVPRTSARADEPAEPPPSAKAEKPKTDDASIFADWKLCKQRGAKHNRDRAEFWQSKTSGKDLMWLGRMWQRGEDYVKAAAVFEQFLEYKPPASDEKGVSQNLTNRETARGALIEVHFAGREFAKSVAAAEKFREEFPTSAVANDTYTDQGRAERMLGDDAKALASFEKAAEKQFRALSDIVDLHLANGEPDKAKAAVEKLGPGLDKQVEKVKWLREMLEVVGTSVPSLDVAVTVGPEGSTLPKSYEKVTVLFYWSVQSANADRKLEAIEMIRRKSAEKVNAIGVLTYKKYNVETMKVEEGLTNEQEAVGVTKLIGQSPARLPPCALVPQAFLDGAKIKWDSQITVIDGEGKLRWARINESKPYDLSALEKVIEKLTAAK